MKIRMLFFGVAMFFAALTQGWGADMCGVPGGFSATLNASAAFTKSNSVNKNNPDNYYFTAPSAGTVTIKFTANPDNKALFNVSTTNCPTASNGKTQTTLTLTASDLDFNVKVYRSTSLFDNGSSSKNYTISVSFVPFATNVNVSERSFTIRSQYNIKGNVAVIGNTVLCNQNNSGQCINDDYGKTNSELNLKYIDVDGVSRTYNNSSQAKLSIPSGAIVKWAGIYTQGYLNKSNQVTAANILLDDVYITVPTLGTIASKPSVIDMLANKGDGYTYSTFAPLDELIGKSGAQINGWITGANIKANTGTENSGLSNYGAWTLVVVYEDPNESLKNITVFDGYKKVANQTGYNTVEIPVSGFLTPRSGDVKSTLSIFAGEGDKNIQGDKLYLKAGSGSYVALNETNAFYSTLMGVTANPSYSNTQGIDIQNHSVGVDGDSSHKQIIGPNVTSATIKLTSTQDTYFPSVAVFTTELYVPDVCYEEVISKNGSIVTGYVDVGDILDINVTVKNKGNEQAAGVSVQKQYDPQMPYLEDSMLVKNLGETAYTAKTDDKGDDIAEYDTETGTTTYYLGSGASASGGGTLNYNQAASFQYKVRVDDFINHSLQNKYLVSYQNLQLGIPFSGVQMSVCSGQPPTGIIIKNPNLITQCGIFPDAISSGTSITMQNGGYTILNSGNSLTAPSLINVNNVGICDGDVCTANNGKPYIIAFPPFLTSGVTTTTNINSSTTISDRLVGNITTPSTNTDTVNVTFSAPYDSSYGGNVMFVKWITNQSNKPVNYTFNEGDYWIEGWTLDGNNAVTVTTNGKVRFFIYNTWTIQNNNSFTMSANSGNAYIFAYNNIAYQSSSSMSFTNVYTYAKGSITLQNNNTSFSYTGAITAEGAINVQLAKPSTITYRSSGLTDDGYGSCATPTSNYPFDAWEVGGGLSAKNIYTKIAGQSFNLSIASLNDARTDLVARDATVSVQIVDADNTDIFYSDPQTVTFANQSIQSATFSPTKATKKAKIKIVNNDANTTVCTSSTPCYSTDEFAIRPASFSGSIGGFRAGEAASFTNPAIKATKYSSNVASAGYSTTLGISSVNAVTLISSDKCASHTVSSMLNDINITFENGSATKIDGLFKDIGTSFGVSLVDSTWIANSDDASNRHCIIGSISNNADSSGRIGCNVGGDIYVTVLPYEIGPYNITQDSWVYMGVSDTPKASIKSDIKATAKDGSLTQNFSKDCYASDVNMDITTSVSGNKSLDNISFGANITKGSNSIAATIPASDFLNGSASLNIDFYSNKISASSPEEPFDMTASTFKASSSGVNYSIFNSDKKTTFIYGKLSMPNAMLDYVSSVVLRAYAQVYATDPATLPGEAGGWMNAPGSSVWWINRLDSGGGISSVLPRASSILKDDNTTDTYAGIKSSVTSNIFGGIAQINLDMQNAQNKDQKIYLHLNVPDYLWYGSKSYSFNTNSDCSQHPCASVDIFGTQEDPNWYGSGEKKGDKAIKTVPKGKRAPKVNW